MEPTVVPPAARGVHLDPTVAIVEDHLLQRLRTQELLSERGGYAVVFHAETSREFAAWLAQRPQEQWPELLVLDLQVDRGESVQLEFVQALLRSGMKVVVLSALSSPAQVRDMVKAGVHAVLGKRDAEEDILAALAGVLSGKTWLTTELATVIAGDSGRTPLSGQEERALVLYASGLSVAQVGEAMNVQPSTAKQYLDRVRAKYTQVGVKASTQLDLGRIAWSEGLVDPRA